MDRDPETRNVHRLLYEFQTAIDNLATKKLRYTACADKLCPLVTEFGDRMKEE